MSEELIELKSYEETSGVAWTIRNKRVRLSTLNEIYRYWMEDFCCISPQQASHIRRAMALAIHEQDTIQSSRGTSQ